MSIREVIEWIGVTERLPDDTRNVLVESPGDDDMEPVWMGFYGSVEEQWYSVGAEPIEGVVRWAEMPMGEASTDALIVTAPKLLELARKYASECADCDGTGEIPKNYGSRGDPIDDYAVPCPDCKDIREVIAAATGGEAS